MAQPPTEIEDRDRRVIDGTPVMVRIVQAAVDLAVVLVFGVLRALFEALRAALFGERDPIATAPGHPEPDPDGRYAGQGTASVRHVPVDGKSAPDGSRADNT